MPLHTTDEWALCLDPSCDRRRRNEAEASLVRQATADDVAELIALIRSESDRERYLALYVLGLIHEEQRFPEDKLPAFRRAAQEAVDRSELLSKEWTMAHGVLDNIAGDFRAYLEPDLANRGLTVAQFDADLERRVSARRAAGIPQAKPMSVADAVAAVLATVPPDQTRIHEMRADVERWVSQWRDQRSAEALGLLYGRFISNLPLHAVRLQALVDMLGQPASGDERSACYDTSPASCLLLFADASGMLDAMKMN